MSGVIFQVGAASARREAAGRTFFFCCEGCAAYFSVNTARVLAARGLS